MNPIVGLDGRSCFDVYLCADFILSLTYRFQSSMAASRSSLLAKLKKLSSRRVLCALQAEHRIVVIIPSRNNVCSIVTAPPHAHVCISLQVIFYSLCHIIQTFIPPGVIFGIPAVFFNNLRPFYFL